MFYYVIFCLHLLYVLFWKLIDTLFPLFHVFRRRKRDILLFYYVVISNKKCRNKNYRLICYETVGHLVHDKIKNIFGNTFCKKISCAMECILCRKVTFDLRYKVINDRIFSILDIFTIFSGISEIYSTSYLSIPIWSEGQLGGQQRKIIMFVIILKNKML